MDKDKKLNPWKGAKIGRSEMNFTTTNVTW